MYVILSLAFVLSTSRLDAVAILGRSLQKRKKDVYVKSPAILKSFFNRRFTFYIFLEKDCNDIKVVNVSDMHTHTHTQTLLSAYGTFFYCLSPFSGFSFQWNAHSENLFLILRNTASTIVSIYVLLLLWRAPQDSIDTTVSKSFISSSVYTTCAKISYSKKDVLHSAF